MFCGAHGKANGLYAVLDAAQVLKERGRGDIKLLFVGDGSKKPSQVKRATEQGLANCSFLQPVSKLKMPELMDRVEAGLMILDKARAFYHGTSPNKFFDYIASGLPVINNYPGWLAELIRANEAGIYVAPGNPDAFAAALIRMADDPGLARLMGTNARKLAESDFNREILAERLVKWLETHAEQSPN